MKLKKINTINETNKLVIDVTKPVSLICLTFEYELSLYIVVVIKNIPAIGINNKSISSIRYIYK